MMLIMNRYMMIIWHYILSICFIVTLGKKATPDQHISEDVAIYRLIGNDMVLLQLILLLLPLL